MNLYSYLILVYSSFTRYLRLIISRSTIKSSFITSSGTSFRALGLYRILMYIKAQVSLSLEISSSR
jgi:hypothetical protein